MQELPLACTVASSSAAIPALPFCWQVLSLRVRLPCPATTIPCAPARSWPVFHSVDSAGLALDRILPGPAYSPAPDFPIGAVRCESFDPVVRGGRPIQRDHWAGVPSRAADRADRPRLDFPTLAIPLAVVVGFLGADRAEIPGFGALGVDDSALFLGDRAVVWFRQGWFPKPQFALVDWRSLDPIPFGFAEAVGADRPLW